MMPSFIDSHAHPDSALDDLYEVNLYSLHGSMKFYQRTVKAFANSHPDLTIIQGSGWDTSILPVIGPTRYQLDAAVKGRPVVLWDLSGHEVWCNSAALKMAGITRNTPNPPGASSSASPARAPRPARCVKRPRPGDEQDPGLHDGPVRGRPSASAEGRARPVGTTAVYEADLNALAGHSPGPNALAAFEDLAQQGKLTVRYRAALHLDPTSATSPPRSRRRSPSAPSTRPTCSRPTRSSCSWTA